MTSPRILYICQGHPDLQPGGTERFAYDLFRAARADGVQAMYLGCVTRHHRDTKCGTVFQSVGGGADELLLWTQAFDPFYLSRLDGPQFMADFGELVQSFRPDVVHFHHVLFVGVDALFAVRRLAPAARIVLTLHDYIPICPNDGLMTKRTTGHLCQRASPDACHACFPDLDQMLFVLRERHLKNLLRLVDQFIVPSETARALYAAWGLPASKLKILRNARPAVAMPRLRRETTRPRNVFGFFGNLAPHKGVLLALDAAALLAEREKAEFSLQIHGEMRHQSAEFQKRVNDAVAAAGGRITMHGRYEPDELAERMGGVDWVLVPSTWWENAPLVILEAFAHRRPVITADVGGMRELVRDGSDGLLFTFGQAASLVRVMGRAITEPDLWTRLTKAMPAARTITESVAEHLALYANLAAGSDSRAA